MNPGCMANRPVAKRFEGSAVQAHVAADPIQPCIIEALAEIL